MDKESFDKLVETIENAGYEARSYSGRCMYGRTCLGVECSNAAQLVAEIAIAACEEASDTLEVAEIMEALKDPSSDNMGRDIIVYWTDIAWMADEDDDPGVEVITEEYEEEHGRKPRGEGRWAFFIEGKDEPVFFTGDYKDCRASAIAEANDQGAESIMVGT